MMSAPYSDRLYAEQAQYDGLQVVDSAVTWEAIHVRQPN